MFPHRNDSAWEVFAPAKLNLYLNVLGSRADGFHELETLLVPVQIHDQVRWSPSPSSSNQPSLRIRSFLSADHPPLQADGSNLICRAVVRLAQAAGVEPYGTFDLYKRIPLQAGLGGGSSDAAAAMLLANAAWGIRYSHQRLAELAADVGSDVPFFFQRGAAVCRGRGEIVERISALPRMHFVIVKPPTSFSTASVFEAWERNNHRSAKESVATGGLDRLIDCLRRGALAQAGKRMVNRLETAAAALSPWVERLRHELASKNLCGHLMTGSGSAFFGIARSAIQARRVARQLSGGDWAGVFATSSC